MNNDRPCTRLSIEHEEEDDNAISLPITQNATSIPTALHYNPSYHATHALPLIPIRLSDPRISLDERTDGDKCAFVILHFLALSYTSFLMHFFIALLLIVRWPFPRSFHRCSVFASEEDYSLEKKNYKYCGVELSYSTFKSYIESHGLTSCPSFHSQIRLSSSSTRTHARPAKEWSLSGIASRARPRRSSPDSCSPRHYHFFAFIGRSKETTTSTSFRRTASPIRPPLPSSRRTSTRPRALTAESTMKP